MILGITVKGKIMKKSAKKKYLAPKTNKKALKVKMAFGVIAK